MAVKTTLDVGFKLEDDATGSFVTIANTAFQDLKTTLTEYMVLTLTVPKNTVTLIRSFLNLDAQVIAFQTTSPVKIKIGVGTEQVIVRKIAVLTYGTGEGPTQLDFANVSTTTDAQVTLLLGG